MSKQVDAYSSPPLTVRHLDEAAFGILYVHCPHKKTEASRATEKMQLDIHSERNLLKN